MMSSLNRVALGGLGGLMLFGAVLPGDPSLEGTLILERSNPSLEFADGVLLFEGAPVTATVVERHPGGAPSRSEEWVAGRRHGNSVSWHENGQMNELRSYAEGRKEGQHLGWYPDGTLHFDYAFERGEQVGNALEWYPSGVLYRDFNYIRGQESGSQRMWNADGSLRANYVVREGRRFGLIGSKGCTGEPVDASALLNAFDSEGSTDPGSTLGGEG